MSNVHSTSPQQHAFIPSPDLWRREWWCDVVLTVVLLAAAALWDFSGLDLPLARVMGGSEGFPWRRDHGVVLLLHEVPRALSIALVVGLSAGAAVPWGFLKLLTVSDRLQLAASVLGGIAVSTLVKRLSTTSCPWDVDIFGGAVPYVSHWVLGFSDGGPGHCFPAGHASAAFGFVGGWFVLRRVLPPLAAPWLMVAIAGGFVLGIAQQLRGAHFMSHTLWTAVICWSVGAMFECIFRAANSIQVRPQT